MTTLTDMLADEVRPEDAIHSASGVFYVSTTYTTHGPDIIVRGVLSGLGVAEVVLTKGQIVAVER